MKQPLCTTKEKAAKDKAEGIKGLIKDLYTSKLGPPYFQEMAVDYQQDKNIPDRNPGTD